MNTFYFQLTITPSDMFALFVDFVNEIFINAVQESKGSLILRSSNDEFVDIIWATKTFTKLLNENLKKSIKVTFTQKKCKNIDWIKKYQNSITPVDVGGFYVHPSWHKAKKDKKNILIDPALAFGSGHHATSSNCLKAIENYVSKNSTVLDVGCGSGILSIACAKQGAKVDLCDIDEDSISSSISNFKKNGVSFENIWLGSINKATKKYDIIVANIVADVLIFLANDIFKKLKNRGIVILSGILKKYEEKVIQNYKNFIVKESIYKDEWLTLVITKKESNEK